MSKDFEGLPVCQAGPQGELFVVEGESGTIFYHPQEPQGEALNTTWHWGKVEDFVLRWRGEGPRLEFKNRDRRLAIKSLGGVGVARLETTLGHVTPIHVVDKSQVEDIEANLALNSTTYSTEGFIPAEVKLYSGWVSLVYGAVTLRGGAQACSEGWAHFRGDPGRDLSHPGRAEREGVV